MAAWKKPLVWCNDYERDLPFRGVTRDAETMLKKHFNLITPKELKLSPERHKDIHGVISFVGNGRIPSVLENLEKLVSLKIVVSLSAGINHLAHVLPRLKGMGVKVAYTPQAVTKATADMTMALLLASARNIVQGHFESLSLPEGQEPKFNVHGEEVSGATLGIVGMGRIGMEVARRASWGFNMTVLYYNRNRRSESDESEVQARYFENLDDMVQEVDFLVICCPLTDETRYLIGEEELSLMKKSATLINMSRGPVVDTDALVDALTVGKIRAAALDVTDPEPLPPDHPLLEMENVVIQPHRGTATRQTRSGMWDAGMQCLKAALIDKTQIPAECKYNL